MDDRKPLESSFRPHQRDITHLTGAPHDNTRLPSPAREVADLLDQIGVALKEEGKLAGANRFFDQEGIVKILGLSEYRPTHLRLHGVPAKSDASKAHLRAYLVHMGEVPARQDLLYEGSVEYTPAHLADWLYDGARARLQPSPRT